MAVSVLMSGQQTVVADLLPVGTIAKLGNVLKIYSGSEWLPCDGTAYTRTAPAYAQLYAVIGTTFGNGDSVTTFNVPTRDQAKNRPLLSFTASKTFAAFEDDTDIMVDNNGTVVLDIDAGAAIAGVRLSIMNKNANGGIVDIRTNAADATQKCLMPRGLIVLEWDGSQWCLVGKNVTMRVQIVTPGASTWKTPFAALYTVYAIGGGAAGSGGVVAAGTILPGIGGGGGGGTSIKKALAMGVNLNLSIGAGGTTGNGGPTTVSDTGVILSAPGGIAGSSSSSGIGIGGSSNPSQLGQVCVSGADGTVHPNSNASGAGGHGAWGLGVGGSARSSHGNGNPGTAPGGGGGGGYSTSSGSSRAGGIGAAGGVIIEY